MPLMLYVIGWILAALALFVVAALILPVRLEMRAHLGNTFDWSAVLRPLGRYGPRLRIPGKFRRSRPEGAKRAVETARRTRPHLQKILLGRAFARLVSELLARVRLNDMCINVIFGCEDPADTGQLYGDLTPMIFGLAGGSSCAVHVCPVFDRATLLVDASFVASVVPYRLLPPCARFAWSLKGISK